MGHTTPRRRLGKVDFKTIGVSAGFEFVLFNFGIAAQRG
jgi:hypothetical protein